MSRCLTPTQAFWSWLNIFKAPLFSRCQPRCPRDKSRLFLGQRLTQTSTSGLESCCGTFWSPLWFLSAPWPSTSRVLKPRVSFSRPMNQKVGFLNKQWHKDIKTPGAHYNRILQWKTILHILCIICLNSCFDWDSASATKRDTLNFK